MIKTKMIQDAASYSEDRLDTKINNFIKENNIKIIDIKFASTGNNRPTALIIYKEE
jgi:hypothetical protein